jgi:hypothetical protein
MPNHDARLGVYAGLGKGNLWWDRQQCLDTTPEIKTLLRLSARGFFSSVKGKLNFVMAAFQSKLVLFQSPSRLARIRL